MKSELILDMEAEQEEEINEVQVEMYQRQQQ
jgi:hypothetical protein